MRYVYKQPVVAISPPKDLSPPVPASADTLHDLMQRRAEQKKNRLFYHLTEADCNLICTNAQELRFTNGQVIATDGAVIHSIYRIKSGQISLMKAGVKLYDLPQGFFIGEGLFIRGEAQDVFGAALVANGPVVLSEVNLPFVRQLLDMDKILAFKIYRHIASKLSALLFTMVNKVSVEPHAPYLISRSDSSSSNGSDQLSSDHSSSSSITTGSENDLAYPPKAVIMAEEMVSPRSSRKKKASKSTTKDVAFKTYKLYEKTEGGQAMLYSQKVVITNGCKILSRRKIKYNKILDMAKTGKNSVTIIYGVQAKTLFFKDETELNEFYSLVQSLVITSSSPSSSSSSSPSPSPHTTLTAGAAASPSLLAPPKQLVSSGNPLARSTSSDPAQVAADKQVLMKLAVRQDVVKGDVVVAEGDLYQRIYTVASGQLLMKSGDKNLVTIEEGDIFGILTLFHLRPCNITVEVASDTATLLIIPHYKIQELITTNFPLAVRMHKKAAQLVYGQIERILLSREGPVKGYSSSNLI